MYKYSIIIPYYNTKKSLFNTCLNSVLRQEYTDFEVIIIDDGSDLKYYEYLETFIGKDERIRIIHKNNEGVSAARNYGVKLSKGEYIAFVDSDDLVVERFLKEADKIIDEYDPDIVIGGVCMFNDVNEINIDNSNPIDVQALQGENIRALRGSMVSLQKTSYYPRGYISRGPVSRIIKKELAEKVQFNAEVTIGEDIIWNLDVLNACNKICVARRTWYYYYNNSESAVNKFNPKIIELLEKELSVIQSKLNLEQDEEYVAFVDHIGEEFSKVIKCYLGRLSKKEIKSLPEYERYFFKRYPWDTMGEKRYFNLADKKGKFIHIFYKCNALVFATKLWQKRQVKMKYRK